MKRNSLRIFIARLNLLFWEIKFFYIELCNDVKMIEWIYKNFIILMLGADDILVTLD